jgi:hypothetical protein
MTGNLILAISSGFAGFIFGFFASQLMNASKMSSLQDELDSLRYHSQAVDNSYSSAEFGDSAPRTDNFR